MNKNLLVNKKIGKNEIELLLEIFYNMSKKKYIFDIIKTCAYNLVTKSGISISIEDLKSFLLKRQVLNFSKKYEISNIEKTISFWGSISDQLKFYVFKFLEEKDPYNSLQVIVNSGARGNKEQIFQMLGLRGLMVDSTGRVLELPVVRSFKEGLPLLDFLIGTFGSRKGTVDTALKTSDSGYLTRKLIECTYNLSIRLIDCGSNRGLLYSLNRNFLLGRVLLAAVKEDFIQKINKKKVISLKMLQILKKNKFNRLLVRSPITCKGGSNNICQFCYGWDLSKRKMIGLGDNIGIIAAHSLGEPATQMTMRTFHTGGTISNNSADHIVLKFPLSGFTGYFSRFDFEYKCEKMFPLKKLNIKKYFDFFMECKKSNINKKNNIRDIYYVFNLSFNTKKFSTFFLINVFWKQLINFHFTNALKISLYTIGLKSFSDKQYVFLKKIQEIFNFNTQQTLFTYKDTSKIYSEGFDTKTNLIFPLVELLQKKFNFNFFPIFLKHDKKISGLNSKYIFQKEGQLLYLDKEFSTLTNDITQGLPRITTLIDLAFQAEKHSFIESNNIIIPYKERNKKIYLRQGVWLGLLKNLNYNSIFIYLSNTVKIRLNNLKTVLLIRSILAKIYVNTLSNIYLSQGIKLFDINFECLVNLVISLGFFIDTSAFVKKNQKMNFFEFYILYDAFIRNKYISPQFYISVESITNSTKFFEDPLGAIAFQDTKQAIIQSILYNTNDWFNHSKSNIVVANLINTGTNSTFYNRSFNKVETFIKNIGFYF